MRRLRRLSVRQFRSYSEAAIDLDGRHVALTGSNGAGKTNLLEALSMFAPGRGLRRATLTDILRSGADPEDGWGAAVLLSDEDEPIHLSLTAVPPSPFRKKIKIDGEPVMAASEVSEYLRFTWATPAQDRLFMDGPGDRRRFIDRMTLAHDAGHGISAATYDKLMRQRQAVLAEPRWDKGLLDVLERQMAETGVAVAAARVETVRFLAVGYGALRSGVFPSATVQIDGMLEAQLGNLLAADLEDQFAEELATGRHQDAGAGRALKGPHRSDLVVHHAEKAQPARQCSTGEQKALLIGLILAHATALKVQEGGALVLLLDEIAAHLDVHRREALADILETLGCQAVMTGTDPELFAAWGERAQHLRVDEGAIFAP